MLQDCRSVVQMHISKKKKKNTKLSETPQQVLISFFYLWSEIRQASSPQLTLCGGVVQVGSASSPGGPIPACSWRHLFSWEERCSLSRARYLLTLAVRKALKHGLLLSSSRGICLKFLHQCIFSVVNYQRYYARSSIFLIIFSCLQQNALTGKPFH